MNTKKQYDYFYETSIRKPKPLNDENKEKQIKIYENKNNKKGLKSISKLTFVFILAMLLICGFSLFSLVKYETQMMLNMRNIEKLSLELEKITNENDILEASINTQINLDEIKDVAMNKFGMQYPKKDQVIYYDKTESEYVRQKENIPKK